jgi:hypothetical protein
MNEIAEKKITDSVAFGYVLSGKQVKEMVAGKTDKPNGVDPALQIREDRNYKIVDIPLSSFLFSNDIVYDGTVDLKRAEKYAERSIETPIIAAIGKDGVPRVMDGGHRITAARIRGDKTIKALVRDTGVNEFAQDPGMNLGVAKGKVTDSAAFRKWFGDSKVVDDNGQPLVVYHGTSKDFGTFEDNGRGLISFTTTPSLANAFGNRDAGRVIPAYLSVQNPFDYKNDSHVHKLLEAYPKDELSRYTEKDIRDGHWGTIEKPAILTKLGFDGAWTQENFEKVRQIHVFNPNQIKSIFNNGNFDPTNDDISEAPAYHGTPHKGIDKFDNGAFLSGEGSMVYGAGHYFASQKDIAEWYREKLTEDPETVITTLTMPDGKAYQVTTQDGEVMSPGTLLEAKAVALHHARIHGKEGVLLEYEDLPIYLGNYEKEAIDWLKGLSEDDIFSAIETIESQGKGQLYKVEIPEDAEMLNWDKPLSEQPEMVKAALQKLNFIVPEDTPVYQQLDQVHGKGKGEEFSKVIAGRIDTLLKEVKSGQIDGSYFYRTELDGISGANDQAKSEYLRSLGIKGIKYLDGTSRSDGEGAYNFVIFDGGDVAITDTYYAPAYHGTPHRGIDKFSLNKIGTGEGAQVYGYGLYFAEIREVAEFYRENLSAREKNVDAELFNAKRPELSNEIWEKMTATGGWGEDKIDAIRGLLAATLRGDSGFYQEELGKELYKKVQVAARAVFAGGQVYKVELAPKEDEYLIWDKPLSEQSDKVKEALEKKFSLPSFIEDFDTAGLFYKSRVRKFNSDEKASDELSALGIKGIKYLDGASRSKGEGAYNYVIFDGADVAITDTYYARQAGQGQGQKQETTLREILGKAQTESTDKITQQLAKLLGGFIQGEKLDTKVIIDPSANSASYTASKNLITIVLPSAHAESLHEIVHAVTANEMEANPEIKARVISLMDEVRRDLIKKGIISKELLDAIGSARTSQTFKSKLNGKIDANISDIAYAFLNEKEFLAQAFSSRQFQKVLEDVQVRDKGFWKSAFSVLVDIAMTALGIKVDHKSAFTEAVSLVAELAGKEQAPGLNAISLSNMFSPLWSSRLSDTIHTKGSTQTAEHWLRTIEQWKKKGTLPVPVQEELEWSGLEDYLSGLGTQKISRGELEKFVSDNGVRVEEVIKDEGTQKLFDDELRKLFADEGFDLEFDYADDQCYFTNSAGDGVDYNDLPAKLQDALSAYQPVGNTKFADYQLPGGKNYKELLITLPEVKKSDRPKVLTELPEGYDLIKDSSQPEGKVWGVTPPGQIHARPFAGRHATQELATFAAITSINGNAYQDWLKSAPIYRSGHFDEPNILVHVRMNERTDKEGNKVLFLEEIQSDWHQAGRKEGYRSKETLERWEEAKNNRLTVVEKLTAALERDDVQRSFGHSSFPETFNVVTNSYNVESLGLGEEIEQLVHEHNRLKMLSEEATRNLGGLDTPDAPFKTSWSQLAMKRVIRYAVDNGFDKVAWTTGAQQADRYDLGKQVKSISVSRIPDSDLLNLNATTPTGETQEIKYNVKESELSNYVGKDLAEKVIKDKRSFQEYEGGDLKVGGEGMKSFYDKMLTSSTGKFIKQFSSKIATVTFDSDPLRVISRKEYDKIRGVKVSKPVPTKPFVIINKDNIAINDGSFATEEEAQIRIAEKANSAVANQPGFSITPAMIESAMANGMPLFSPRVNSFAQDPSMSLKEAEGKITDSAAKKVARVDISKAIGKNKDELYTILLDASDSGPFDGGCVIAAEGIRGAIGGDIVVLERANGMADHAAVLLNGLLYDFDGPLPEREFIKRFNDNEMAEAVSVRPIKEGDLPEAPRDNETAKKITDVLTGWAIKKITDNPAFKKWFGDSKVVDENGQPLVVYHGTDVPSNFSVFEPYYKKINWFAGDPKLANTYSKNRDTEGYDEDSKVFPVYLSVHKILDLSNAKDANDKGDMLAFLSDIGLSDIIDKVPSCFNKNTYVMELFQRQEVLDGLKERGYDGIKIKENGRLSYAVFNPNQIKSIFNNGNFDPANDDISEAPARHGTQQDSIKEFDDNSKEFIRSTQIKSINGESVMSLKSLKIEQFDFEGADNKQVSSHLEEIFAMEANEEDMQTMYEFARKGEQQQTIQSSKADYIATEIDLDIADKDLDDALETIKKVMETGELQLEEGESRSYFFQSEDEKDAALKEVFVCDLPEEGQPEWASDYTASLSNKLGQMFKNLWVSVLGNIENKKKSMVIAGRAKDVGLAKEKFYAAMSMAGLDIKNGQYEKSAPQNDLLNTRLADHGLDVKRESKYNDVIKLSFDTIGDVPAQYRAEVCQVVIKNLAEDYKALVQLNYDVIRDFKERPEYARVKEITHHYRISEEALFHVLDQSISSKKIDPTGSIKKILDEGHGLTEQLSKQKEKYREAISTVLDAAAEHGIGYADLEKIVDENANGIGLLRSIKTQQDVAYYNKPADAAGPAGPAPAPGA